MPTFSILIEMEKLEQNILKHVKIFLKNSNDQTNILEIFEAYSNLSKQYVRNLIDLIWSDDSLVDFETLTEGLPNEITLPKSHSVQFKYYPIFDTESRLQGILVFCV